MAILEERRLDVSKDFPKPLTDETAQEADVIVTMGCGDTCPVCPGKRYLDWDLVDPAGKPIDEIRLIRDQIEERVISLIGQLGITRTQNAHVSGIPDVPVGDTR